MSGSQPSLERWLSEIKAAAGGGIGILFIHSGVVRGTTRDGRAVSAVQLSYDPALLKSAVAEAEQMPGVTAVRAWINEGTLDVGEEMLRALVAGDIRPNVFAAWSALAKRIKSEVVTQRDIFA